MRRYVVHWPLIVALALLWIAVWKMLGACTARCEGNLIYALDDAYIHMAIAKNLAFHGVWGVTQYAFTSSASSLIWPLLVALAFKLFGQSESVPLILNMICATGLLCVVHFLWRKNSVPAGTALGGLLALTFLMPVLPVMFTGLEHIFHTVVTIIAISAAARVLAEKQEPAQHRKTPLMPVLLTLPLVTIARYEGLFLVLVVAVMLHIRRSMTSAVGAIASGALPVVVYGLISRSQGWSFLPNSVLLKARPVTIGSLQGLENMIYLFGLQVTQNPTVLITMLWSSILLFVLLNKRGTIWQAPTLMLVIYLGMAMLHVLLGTLGWFYRYEAYLVATGIFVIVIATVDAWPSGVRDGADTKLRCAVLVLVLAISCIPFLVRAVKSHADTVMAAGNIYEQQYQMGMFVQRYYEGQCVAANDIGAVCYLGDVKCFDLWGLASVDMARMRTSGTATSDGIADLARQADVKVAIAYDNWFSELGGLPKSWTSVGQWSIKDNVVCGSNQVSIYCTDPSEKDALLMHLREFSADMPSTVGQFGAYLQ